MKTFNLVLPSMLCLIVSVVCCAAAPDGDELLRQYDQIARAAKTPEATTSQRRALLEQMTVEQFDAFIKSFVAAYGNNRDFGIGLSQFAKEFHARKGNAVGSQGICAKAASVDMPWQWRAVLLKTWRPSDQQRWSVDTRKEVYEKLRQIVVGANENPVVVDAAFASLLRFLGNDWKMVSVAEPGIGLAVRADATLDETVTAMTRLPIEAADNARLVSRTLGELRRGLDRMRASGTDAALCDQCQRSLDECLRDIRDVPTTTTAPSLLPSEDR